MTNLKSMIISGERVKLSPSITRIRLAVYKTFFERPEARFGNFELVSVLIWPVS